MLQSLYVFFVMLFFASVTYGQAIDIGITVSDNLGNTKPMAFGLDLTATNGIDPQLGESDLSPFPPGGSFEVRFDLTPYAGIQLSSYKDYRNAASFPFTGQRQHRLIWQLGAGASSLNISYNLPWYAVLQIQDELGGIVINSAPLTGTGIFPITVSVTAVRLNINYTNTGGLSLLIPNGGETWTTGEEHNIKWAPTLINNIKIEYSTNNGNDWLGVINNTASGSGSYLWSVPNTPSEFCKVKISNVSDNTIYDLSNSTFVIADSSVIASYKFSGNADDESGNGYHGIVQGAALTTDRFEDPDKAYYFDGVNDYIDLSNTENLNFSAGGFSIALWVNYTAVKEMIPINKHVYNTPPLSGYAFSTYPPPAIGFFLHMDTTKGLSTSGSYNDGSWHLAAASYSGSEIKLYVDGQLINTLPGQSYTNFNSAPIRVGKFSSNNPDPAFCFSGKIDDILIYNRVLTAQEIQTLYYALPGTPVLFYPLNGSINHPQDQTFQWYSAEKTGSYHLQVSTDSLFNGLVYQDSLIIDSIKTVAGLTNNTRYFWRVKGANYSAQSSWSEIWSFYTTVKPPVLSSISAGGDQITLNWVQAPLNNISSFKIFRDTIPSPSILLAVTDSNQFSFTDTNFIVNITYYYRLKAVSIYGIESDFSNELSGIPIQTFQFAVNIVNNWNIVSIPGLLPYNQNVTSWWAGKDPAANVFRFQGNYQTVTSVEPGKGYWMKHLGTNLYNTGDEWPATGIQLFAHNPIDAATGWNLIGVYEDTVVAANLTTIPSGLITGSVFRYAGGYQPAAELIPGYGYWVKLSGAGSINIPAGASGPAKVIAGTENFGKITITDNAQKSYTLYAAEGNADLTQFDLPPLPPQGMFDVRYSTQRYAEKLSSTPQEIEMTGVQYPVKVKAEGAGIILSDESGKEIARLQEGEEVTLNTASKLFVTGNVIPSVYALDQNYPNPFNPSTTIQFSIPEDVQNVKLIVYSSLGEKVAELVNTGLQAGIYKYSWNATDVSSGLYIYQMVTEKFVSTKKMMLLK